MHSCCYSVIQQELVKMSLNDCRYRVDLSIQVDTYPKLQIACVWVKIIAFL